MTWVRETGEGKGKLVENEIDHRLGGAASLPPPPPPSAFLHMPTLPPAVPFTWVTDTRSKNRKIYSDYHHTDGIILASYSTIEYDNPLRYNLMNGLCLPCFLG